MIRDPELLAMTDGLLRVGPYWKAVGAVSKQFKREFGMKSEARGWLKDLMGAKYGMVL